MEVKRNITMEGTCFVSMLSRKDDSGLHLVCSAYTPRDKPVLSLADVWKGLGEEEPEFDGDFILKEDESSHGPGLFVTLYNPYPDLSYVVDIRGDDVVIQYMKGDAFSGDTIHVAYPGIDAIMKEHRKLDLYAGSSSEAFQFPVELFKLLYEKGVCGV